MILTSKFNIGQKIKHKLFGFSGVIIDIDYKYSIQELNLEESLIHKTFKKSPWYHVIMEDDNGYPIHIYLAEDQISWENKNEYLEKTSLDKLSSSIKKQFKKPKLRN